MFPSILIAAMILSTASGPLATALQTTGGFRSVFDQYAPYVWRTVRRLGVRPSDVEDVCQEVFLVVFRRSDAFDGSSSIKTWIYGICVRTASNYRRRAHVRREELTDVPPDAITAADQEQRRAAVEALDRALSGLDEDKRAVFVLYEIEQLSMKEVAEALGCPLQTAYSRLHAARAQVVASSGDGQSRRDDA
jgi:RNA polymerase sigma-70 factor, ECF subfamily